MRMHGWRKRPLPLVMLAIIAVTASASGSTMELHARMPRFQPEAEFAR